MRFKRNKVALACILASGAVSSLAVAQTPPDQPSGTIRVDVTGTNIRRVDSETPAPVQVITQEQMVREGYTTIAEVLRDVTANGQGLLSQGFSRAFAGGASGVALRGLGVGATLVLIDGLRMVPYPLADDGQRNFVDVSSIPFQAVERIEVLLDGASAIYGSDAIGGVVNIILKKNFTGSQFVGDAGSTTQGGGTTWHASLTQGFGQSTDTASGFLTFEYRHQDQIKLDQRSGDWANFNWTGQGGNDLRPGSYSPDAGITTPRGGVPYLLNFGQSINNPANYAFLNSNCSFAALRANQCVYTDTWSQIMPTTQNVNVVGRLNLNLPNDWQAVLTGSWFDSYSQQTNSQSPMPQNSFAGNTVIGLNQIPYISPPIPQFTVPASYPGNPFGGPASVRAAPFDVPFRVSDFDNTTTRLVATLGGPALGWDWSFAAGYQFSQSDTTYRGYLNNYALYAALNDPVHPYNLLGGNSPDVVGKVQPTVNKTATNELDFLQFTTTKDLMKLDGGPLGLALGGGTFYNRLYAPNANAVSNGTVSGINAFYAAGTQTNWNVYGELSAPVLKTLELDAAVRYDWYNTYGGQVVPKVGAKWTPIKEIGLRGTWGQGFRAPDPAEAGQSGSLFGFNAIRDPVNCPASNPNGTPDVHSPQNVVSPSACNFAPTYLQTSNPDLKAEKSNNWTIGAIFEPIPKWLTTVDYYDIELKNQIIPAVNSPDYNPLDFVVRGPQQIVTFGDGHTGLSPAGLIAYAGSPYINGQKTTTTGLDFASSYTFTLPDTSTLMLAGQWSHIFTYDLTLAGVTYKLAGTHGPTVVSGDTGNPKDRFNVTLQWAKGPWTVTALVNYVGSYNMTDPSVGLNNCADGINAGNGQRWTNVDPPSQYCNTGSFTWVNLNVQYQVNKQLMIQATGTNIFNAKPPVDMSTYAGTGLNLTSNQTGAPYNPSMAAAGIIGPTWSVGLVYNFDVMQLANQVGSMVSK